MNPSSRIPRVAAGERPVFSAGGEEINQLLAAVAALTSEVAVLRHRVRTLEALGERAGWLAHGGVDGFEPDPAMREEQARFDEDLLRRVFYRMLRDESPADGSPAPRPSAPPPAPR